HLRSPSSHRVLPSFPTRRSSDLFRPSALALTHFGAFFDVDRHLGALDDELVRLERLDASIGRDAFLDEHRRRLAANAGDVEERRSEEHTSELQSLTNLLCRLLLE